MLATNVHGVLLFQPDNKYGEASSADRTEERFSVLR
jgi:hypothetical protein